MPTSGDHRIRRQHWRVRAHTRSEAFALRQRLRDAWAGLLAPVFAQAFDARARAGEIVRLPRLHLRLCLAPGEDPLARLPELLAHALAEQWPREAPPQDPTTPPQPREPAHPSAGSEHHRQSAPAHASSILRDDLFAYLHTGDLPWSLAGRPAEEIRVQLASLAECERPALLSYWSEQPPSAEALARLLQLTPVPHWPGLARVLCALPRPIPAGSAAVTTGVESAVESAATPSAVARLILATLKESSAASPSPASRPAARRRPPSAQDSTHSPPAPTTGLHAPPHLHGASGSQPRSSEPAAPAKVDDPQHRHRATTPPPRGRDRPSHVPHAGLVLLHPFLPRFFAATGVLSPTAAPPAIDAQPRAAALLHLLATGSEAAPCDFELPALRILLGLAPDDPLQADATPSAHDRAEADALLHSVITHWSALRSTSPAGLRTTFLQRSGLLRPIDGAWLLQLERGPFDVLLDRLPWALGVIRLPWMPRPLHTEW